MIPANEDVIWPFFTYRMAINVNTVSKTEPKLRVMIRVLIL
jgi:hypothetical protein